MNVLFEQSVADSKEAASNDDPDPFSRRTAVWCVHETAGRGEW